MKDKTKQKGKVVKNKILEKLKTDKDLYVSGEALSGEIGVSRTAVWKYVKELRSQGYIIEASSKKGYKLISALDILNEYEIRFNLKTDFIGRNIKYFRVIDSTNTYAKRIAEEGCDNGTIVVADSQTSGKGRLGRIWDSADKKGIWMSVVLRPSVAPGDVQIITLGAAAAVVNAIYKTTGIKAGIKWPNDIILEGKKICGILTEMNTEMDKVNFLVVGIGLNVNHEAKDFPDGIKDIATSMRYYADTNKLQVNELVKEGFFNRSEIIKSILFELERIYSKIENGCLEEIIEVWKSNSVTLGREVCMTLRNVQYLGIAKDISEGGKLVVQCTDGVCREVTSGEVSIRGVLGYV